MKKRILSLLLSTALVVATLVNPMVLQANAEETGAPTQMTIDEFRTEKTSGTDANGNAYEYYTKVPTAPEGYVFGGWYTTEDCDKAIPKTQTTGTAWAKWVDKDVLAVKYQVSASTTAASQTTNMRLVTSVDSENYRAVGFVLNYGQGDSKPAMSKDVYSSIKGLVGGVETYYYANQEFDTTSQYFMIYEIFNIPQSVFDASINVTPQWETLDGTVVKGTPNTVKISDTYQEEAVTIGGDSNYTFVQRFDMPALAGDTLTFDIELFNGGAKTYTMRIMENGDWSDTLHVTSGNTATRKTVSITFTKDIEFFNLWLQYEDSAPDPNVCFKVRNVDVCTKISGNAYTFSHPITMSGKAGQTLSFDIELFNTDTTYTMRIMENGDWSDTLHVTTGNTAAKQTVSVILTQDITYFNIWLQYADETPDANRAFVVRNIKIETPTSATIGYSGTTTAMFPMSVKVGQIISFDIEKKSAGSYTLYVLENGEWGEYEHALGSQAAAKHTISVAAKHDIANFVIWAQISEGTIDGIEITNVKVETPTSALIGYSGTTTATFPISAVQGQVISFDIEKKSAGSYTLYVLENGGWGEYEHYLGSLSATKQTIRVPAKHDIDNFMIWTQITDGATDGIEITNVKVDDTSAIIGGGYRTLCDLPIVAQAGQTLTFNIDAPDGAGYTFHVLENAEWGGSLEHHYNFTGDQQVTVTINNNVDKIRFQVDSDTRLELTNIQVQ